MQKVFVCTAICLIFFSQGYVFPQAEESGPNQYERWEESLRFGIDSSVVETIDEMIEEADDRFSDEVLALFSSRRQTLRIKSLDFFEALESDAAIDSVLEELEFYQDLPASFIIRLLVHLERREHSFNPRLWNLIREIIEEEGRDVQIAAIRYTGSAAHRPAAPFLVERYEDRDSTLPVQEAILRALGSIQNPDSQELIFDLARDESIEKTLRIAAMQAAGKYANREALEVIGEAFSSEDPLIRSAAIGSLADYPIEESADLYIEALRDSFWRIRLGALRGIAETPFVAALDAAQYMASRDPEANIRTQAYKTVAAIDRPQGWNFLREQLESEEISVSLRQTIAAELISRNFPASKTEIERVMASEWEKDNSQLLDTICKTLSRTELVGAGDLYRRMLGHPNYIIQIYGVRGIGKNSLQGFRDDLQAIIESDESHPALKSNAELAIEEL